MRLNRKITALGIVALVVLVAVGAVKLVNAAVDTNLTVNSSNQYPVSGQTITISGTLMTSDHVPIVNQPVMLTTYPWSPGDGTTIMTDAGGAYEFTSLYLPPGQVGQSVTVTYTVSYAGNADYNPSSSYTLVYVKSF